MKKPTNFETCLLDKKVFSFAEPHGIIFYPLMKENIFDVTLAMFNTDPVHCFVCFLMCENVCPYVIFCASPNFFFCLLTSQPCKWICQVKQHQMLSRDSDTFLCSVILTISAVKRKKGHDFPSVNPGFNVPFLMHFNLICDLLLI